MTGIPLLVPLLLFAPLFAGCLAGQAPPEDLEIAAVTDESIAPSALVDELPDATLADATPAAALPPPPPPPRPVPRLRLAQIETAGGAPLFFNGRPLEPHPDGRDAPCRAGVCTRHPFEVFVPDGFWDEHDGALEISIKWEGIDESADFDLDVLDAEGETVAEADWAQYARVAILDEPASGVYVAFVRAMAGSAAYHGVLQLELTEATAPDGELLPNIAALPPIGFSLVQRDYYTLPELEPVLGGAGTSGCGADEIAEQQVLHCLRFGTSVANVGAGPLEVRLPAAEIPLAVAKQGQFLQRIYSSDGSYREEPVGPAYLHPTHAHLHYDGLATFDLFDYDLASGMRGDAVAEGRKAGFCMVDEGLAQLGLPGTHGPVYGGDGCLPVPEDRYMGISPNWFDRYELDRPDQYVEVSGLPDGVYEVVVTADGGETLIESNETDNQAGAIIRIADDAVEVLSVWSAGVVI